MEKLVKPILASILALYLIMQLFSLKLQKREEKNFLHRTVIYITSPGQKAVDFVADWISDIWVHYLWLVDTSKQNENLIKENHLLKGELVQLKNIRNENDRLRSMLEIQASSPLRLLIAKRIANGATAYEKVIRIQKGSKHGIQRADPVLHSLGLVGQVLDSFDHVSDILLLTDVASAADVVVARSRVRGIVKADRSNMLRLEFVEKDAEIEVGDELLTSGLDGVFPEGIPVGRVSSVRRSEKSLFLTAKVEPFVDFDRLDEVFVSIKEDHL